MKRNLQMELSRLQYNSVYAGEKKRAEREGTEPRPMEEILVDIFQFTAQNEAEDGGYNILTPIEAIIPDMQWVDVIPADERHAAIQNLRMKASYETDEEEPAEPETPAEAPSEPVEATEEAE